MTAWFCVASGAPVARMTASGSPPTMLNATRSTLVAASSCSMPCNRILCRSSSARTASSNAKPSASPVVTRTTDSSPRAASSRTMAPACWSYPTIVRKKTPGAAAGRTVGWVAAGEMTVTPASAASGRSRSASADVAGPMTTSTPRSTRSANAVSRRCCDASPESRYSTSTGWLSTPPAALISRTATSTAATIAGPINETSPLIGNSVPMRSTPSPLGRSVSVARGVGAGKGRGTAHPASMIATVTPTAMMASRLMTALL